MLSRLLGLETEYAIRYSAPPNVRRPGNDVIYTALAKAIRSLVSTHRGERGVDTGSEQLFTENGGAVCYEFSPQALNGGLLEASTPECRGPSQLLLYQKAEEALLLRAIPIAQQILSARGYEGEVGLLKNCRDAEGHVYGAQENYEVEVASGARLWLYRAGLMLLFPLIALDFVISWLFLAVLFVGIATLFAAHGIVALFAPRLRPKMGLLDWVADEHTGLKRSIGTAMLWAEIILRAPVLIPFSLLLRAFAFCRIRRGLMSFLVSRPVLTGTGMLDPGGAFSLSEKGPAIRRTMRSSPTPANRPIFDTGNLMKRMTLMIDLRFRPLLRLFHRRQRLQLGLSDSNGSQLAEYLKVGTTALCIDMAEEGLLEDAPVLVRPIEALHAIARDPTLRVRVALRPGAGGGLGTSARALDLQRFYWERAREYVERSPSPSLEARDVVRLWGEALEALDRDPSSLVGRLDWVTKRYLIEVAAGGASDEAQKKVDLKYHELGSGYLAEMERAGLAPVLVEAAEIARAMTTPPDSTPARMRGRLVKELAGAPDRVTVSWDSVQIGGRVRGTVIRLDQHRGPGAET